MSYTFNGGASGSKRKTRSSSPGMHFAAFYADCYHEVSKLTSGHRVALVYHLTANVVPNPMTSHLPSPSPTPSQPADESIAIRLSKLMETYDREGDEEYPCTWEGYPSSEWEELGEWPGKPDKLVIVLSHHYTPANLTSIKALKGSDRSVAELIRAAAFCSPSGADGVTSLARLAAKKVVEEGGQDYATTPSLAHEMIAEEFKGKDGSGPFFDAAISLATLMIQVRVGLPAVNTNYSEQAPSVQQDLSSRLQGKVPCLLISGPSFLVTLRPITTHPGLVRTGLTISVQKMTMAGLITTLKVAQ